MSIDIHEPTDNDKELARLAEEANNHPHHIRGEFHWRDGWYFSRKEDGTVHVRRAYEGLEQIGAVLDIPAAEWASIVASVSARGETGGTYAEAVRFHSLTVVTV